MYCLIRHYRDRNDETPSHTGGVSDEYLKKAKGKREHDRGVYASSKDKERHERYDSGRGQFILSYGFWVELTLSYLYMKFHQQFNSSAALFETAVFIQYSQI
jgi:hypothetical protein